MHNFVNKRRRDYIGGILLFLFGSVATVQGASYSVGSLTQMGPGFFPVALGVLLTLCGVALLIATTVSSPSEQKEQLRPEWAAWGYILGGIAAFVVLGKYGGLVPATFALVFISALADHQNTLRSALTLSLAMVSLTVVVFWWALQLQFPLFTWG